MTEIKMPMLGLTMEFGTITNWLKKEGDAVKKGEAILQIETEKLENDVEAPEDGILLKIVTPVGSEVPVKGIMGYIGAEGEAVAGVAAGHTEAGAPAAEEKTTVVATSDIAPAAAASGERLRVTPIARKLAGQLGVDLYSVKGTGPAGRICRKDVELAARTAQAPATPAAVPAAVPAAPVLEAEDAFELLPYTGIRKRIGDNMVNSWNTYPKVTHMVSVDVAELLKTRALINDGKEKKDKVSVTDLLVFLTARCLREYPSINSSLTQDGIRRYRHVNIGVAVATERGLLIPVVKHADEKGLGAISRELKELIANARSGKLAPDDMHGATFTISNLGGYGSVDYFTPIINQPEAAIMGVGRTVDTPIAVDGQVVIHPVMSLSLSYDHRLIDGAVAAEFAADFMKMLKQPIQTILLG